MILANSSKPRSVRLSRRPKPFDSDQHIFEPKIDGFRALAHIEAGGCELVPEMETHSVALGISPHGSPNIFMLRVPSSMAILRASMRAADQFSVILLFRRRQSVFIAFDLFYLNGKDLRT